ncbi:MAG: hypothetical protein EP302_08610 [Bacteroidetes bacterium]|nr:MAG: hypothetical protein EP302_08610 [Bacteroidota bacterium]UCE68248.1 MAG: hypothetical protein JSW57_07210 [Flavobacteriaceae bacterium]
MSFFQIPKQPHPWVSYYRVGRLLHWALLLFFLESYVYWIMLEAAFIGGNIYRIGFWLWSFLFSFIHIFLVIMDGWSRFQDYKKAKDLFYLYGVKPRIAEWFIGSKCQRNAALQAAQELGMEDEVQRYFSGRGVKWFHYVPYFMVRDPLFLIRKAFWERTFLEKYYAPKFNFREIQLEGAG